MLFIGDMVIGFFEKKYYDLLDKANRIIVIDSIGHTKFQIYRDELLIEAFPLENEEFLNKSELIAGNLEKLWPFYHSKADNIEKVKHIEVEEILDYLKRL